MMAKQVPQTGTKKQSSVEMTSNNKAAAAFVRRVLVSPHLSTTNTSHTADSQPADAPVIDTSLPPLTSVNEIDLQLYALIAILVKDCIYSWYFRFSLDPDFVDDLLQVIAHCTRASEERLRHVDMEQLLMDEIPAIIEAHVETFRQCKQLAEIQNATKDVGFFYATFRPHPALLPVPKTNAATAEQACNDSLYRQLLTDGMLALLLPTEDLRNPCLRSLMAEVLGDMILGGFVGGKLCDSIFIYDTIKRIARSSASRRKPWAIDPHQQSTARENRLTRSGLLTSHTTTKESLVKNFDVNESIAMVLQYCMTFINFVQFFFSRAMSTATSPPQTSTTDYLSLNKRPEISLDHPEKDEVPPSISISPAPTSRPIITYRVWSLASCLLNMQIRMPWLSGILALLQHGLLNGIGGLGSTDSRLDMILAHYLLTPTFPLSKHLPSILSSLRTSLFPNNTLLQSGPSENPAPDVKFTKTQSRRAAAFAILNLIPPAAATLYFAPRMPTQTSELSRQDPENVDRTRTEAMVQAIEEDILAPFGENKYLTRHLAYSILDCLVVKVFPELRDSGVTAALAGKEVVPI